jgi:hypothetical protein
MVLAAQPRRRSWCTRYFLCTCLKIEYGILDRTGEIAQRNGMVALTVDSDVHVAIGFLFWPIDTNLAFSTVSDGETLFDQFKFGHRNAVGPKQLREENRLLQKGNAVDALF